MSGEALKNLLDDVACALQKENARKSRNFNVFEVLRVGTDEVRMCRVLAELLDPNGTHGQERLYLDLFFENVLDIDKPDCNKAITVRKEWPIDNDRRIDIVIKNDMLLIPIEVKIYAGDQGNQCADYLKYAKDAYLYYLTIDGHSPSDYSVGTMPSDKIRLISWRGSILSWLNACVKATTGEQNATVRIVLEQFVQAIKNFCEKEDVIVDIIQRSPDYVQAALEIVKCVSALVNNKLDEIGNVLSESPYCWKRPVTDDKSKTYIVDESAPLFFRIQTEGNSIVACLITGVNKNGKWTFSGGAEYKENFDKINISGKDGKGWWLRKEVIIAANEFHLLFNEDKLNGYIARIIEFYRDCKELTYEQ